MRAHTTTRSTQINRHKHTGKKHKPFGTVSVSREGFKAHWHEFMITALCLCQTSTVVVFPLAPSPSLLYALPSPWSELWKMLAGVPQSQKGVCVCTVCVCVRVCMDMCMHLQCLEWNILNWLNLFYIISPGLALLSLFWAPTLCTVQFHNSTMILLPSLWFCSILCTLLT